MINGLLTRSEWHKLIEDIETFFYIPGEELRSIEDISLGFDSKEYRVEGYRPISKMPCFYYQKAGLMAEILSAQSDFFDDLSPEEFNKFLDIFKTKGG